MSCSSQYNDWGFVLELLLSYETTLKSLYKNAVGRSVCPSRDNFRTHQLLKFCIRISTYTHAKKI